MFRIQLQDYITIGSNISTLQHLLLSEGARYGMQGGLPISKSDSVIAVVGQLRDACAALGLETSQAVIDDTMRSFRGPDQIDVLITVVKRELANRLFLHLPSERAKYWETDRHPSEHCRATFPVAASEMRSCGTAYACGLWNAAVFHAMRAAEDALCKVADELGVERSGAEQWGKLIDQIEAKLGTVAKLPKTNQTKKEHLRPLSEVVIDLRLFKDAWRNQIAHNVVAYSDGHARTISDAVSRVLEALAARHLAAGEQSP